MKPVRPRWALVERRVTELLAKYGVNEPPIPIETLIRSEGIELHYPDLGDDVSGVLVRQSGGMVIGVNRRHSKARQRFTAAHELGHALLHEGSEVHHDQVFRMNLRSDLSSQGIDPEEIEANHFAASLLMPRITLERDPSAFLIEIEDATAVSSLARRYGVSAHAMALRLAALSRVRS